MRLKCRRPYRAPDLPRWGPGGCCRQIKSPGCRSCRPARHRIAAASTPTLLHGRLPAQQIGSTSLDQATFTWEDAAGTVRRASSTPLVGAAANGTQPDRRAATLTGSHHEETWAHPPPCVRRGKEVKTNRQGPASQGARLRVEGPERRQTDQISVQPRKAKNPRCSRPSHHLIFPDVVKTRKRNTRHPGTAVSRKASSPRAGAGAPSPAPGR